MKTKIFRLKHRIKILTRDEVSSLLLMAALSFGTTFVGYFLTIKWVVPIPRDGTGMVVGRDFFNFWMYGRAAFTPDPGRFYHWPTYVEALIAALGENSRQSWSYPPSIMLLAAPFGRLPYMSAYLLWTARTTGIFLAVARKQFGEMRLVFLALLSPAAMFGFLSGQSALLTSAMVLGIFSLLDRRPLVAGLLIGCLSLKPQLGLMFPIMLLVTQRWRAFAAAAATTLGLALLTALLFGPQVWVQFITEGLPTQTWVFRDAEMQGAPFMPTIFMNARQLGLGYAPALAVQTLFSAAAIVTVGWAFWKHQNADKAILFALFTACTVCGSPYLLSYDLMPLTCALVFLMARGLGNTEGRLVFLLYWLTMIQLAFGLAHIPGPALLVPAFVVVLVRQLSQTGQRARLASPYPQA